MSKKDRDNHAALQRLHRAEALALRALARARSPGARRRALRALKNAGTRLDSALLAD